MEGHALGGERFLEKGGELEIKAQRDARQEFQHDHLRAEPAPDRAQLEADRPAPDDKKLFRRLFESERFGAAHDDVAVEFHIGEFHRYAAGRDDHVRALDLLAVALIRFDRHAAGRRYRSKTLERRDLVALHQHFHAAVHGLHDLVFTGEHLRQIEPDGLQDDAVLGGFLLRENIMIARSEKRLTRDAPDVQAGAAEVLVFLDKGGFEAELGRADGSHVTAWARADDDDVELVH
jgi:hypothetical protein